MRRFLVIILLILSAVILSPMPAGAASCSSVIGYTPSVGGSWASGGGSITCPSGHAHVGTIKLQYRSAGVWYTAASLSNNNIQGAWQAFPGRSVCNGPYTLWRSRAEGTGFVLDDSLWIESYKVPC